ncbi:cyclic pyranopterin monophosphate synthase MoaC [Candidatus Omnitrophota bacterium]
MKMIDVGNKNITQREAIVEGRVRLKPSVIRTIRQKKLPKGDVLEAAKIAGILAAKKTPELIPLCHPIPIEYADIKFSIKKSQIDIVVTIRGRARTGVEMEAFTAVAVAAVTIYDMCKSLDRSIVIGPIQLLKKSGGKSGTYIRKTNN